MPRWIRAHMQKNEFLFEHFCCSPVYSSPVVRASALLLAPIEGVALTIGTVPSDKCNSFFLNITAIFCRWLCLLFPFSLPTHAPVLFPLLPPCHYILPPGLKIPLLSLNGQLSHLLVSIALSLPIDDSVQVVC